MIDPRVEQAMALFSAGNPEQSRALLQEAQAEDPANPDILLALGQVCVSTNDLETAESCLSALPEDIRDGTDVVTRYDKTAESFLGFIDITSIRLWLRDLST